MKSYMLKHKGKYKCRKIFEKKLDEHIKKSHDNTSTCFACTECEAKFMAGHALKQHTKAVHDATNKLLPALIVKRIHK